MVDLDGVLSQLTDQLDDGREDVAERMVPEGDRRGPPRAAQADDLDQVITEMLETPGPVIADIRVAKEENCFPMIPSGAAHNDMLLGPDDQAQKPVSEEGMVLV